MKTAHLERLQGHPMFDESSQSGDNRGVASSRVGLWRSWERASMAWKRSSVRSRPGPPILCDAYRLHPTKRKNKQVLHWLRNRSACSTDTASARTDYFNPWSRTLGLGISRAVRNISRS